MSEVKEVVDKKRKADETKETPQATEKRQKVDSNGSESPQKESDVSDKVNLFSVQQTTVNLSLKFLKIVTISKYLFYSNSRVYKSFCI